MLAAYLYESTVCVSMSGSSAARAERTAFAAAVWPTPTLAERKRTRAKLLRCGFFRKDAEVVEDFLRELIVRQQLAHVVGHDEFVDRLVVGNGVAVLLLIFDDADDLVLEFLTVRRPDHDDVV